MGCAASADKSTVLVDGVQPDLVERKGDGNKTRDVNFSHCDASGSWHQYSAAQSAEIAAAIAAKPKGGSVLLAGTTYSVQWGSSAVSPRMATPSSKMLQVNQANGNTRAVRQDEPPAVEAELRAPVVAAKPAPTPPAPKLPAPAVSCSFSHKSPDGTWTSYSADVAALIHAAQAAKPAGGRLALPSGPFELRWGVEATSKKLSKPPPTGMIQVNLTNENT